MANRLADFVYVYVVGPTHGETSTRDGINFKRERIRENESKTEREKERERKRTSENERNNKHTYIPKRVSFKDS